MWEKILDLIKTKPSVYVYVYNAIQAEEGLIPRIQEQEVPQIVP
jgi:hypothetical protein